jgi:serine/threonine protein kinase HipA of HipAB toxin-antitoxin module
VCEAELAPLSAIKAEHSYALPDEPDFLAVTRFDRDGARRIHFEDFAQVLAVDPMHKYSASYLDMALAMQAFPSLGEDAVLELVRRLAVNDLLGNPDAHLKNFGVLYADGIAPRLAPAYDIVAYAALQGVDGHALPLLPPQAHAQAHRPLHARQRARLLLLDRPARTAGAPRGRRHRTARAQPLARNDRRLDTARAMEKAAAATLAGTPLAARHGQARQIDKQKNTPPRMIQPFTPQPIRGSSNS